MRRALAWAVMVGVLIIGSATPVRAADGFWVSIATGVAESATPTGYQEWWFETPHGPAPVAVTQFTGGSAEATTGGGTAFFTGGAVPVVLHTTDGYGYLAGGAKPGDLSEALKRQTAGGRGLASAAPDASALTPPPADANLLSVEIGDPNDTGGRVVTAGLTDPSGAPLGSGSATMPDGGWWVLGLGPNPNEITPPPDPDPEPEPEPNPEPTPVPVPSPGGGPVTTPEPATGVLLGLGGLMGFGWRLVKRRRQNG
ncbi:MAG: PEP-CTERM sorting domain-containing protein [Planctomycetia bacterium]|nr:PEP-CTERM sorting domain-containing protein [Planctomycetia bacterium]